MSDPKPAANLPRPPPASPLVVGKHNLRTAPFSPSQGAAAPEGLSSVYDALVKKAEEALHWYEVSQRAKRRGARITRSVAIVFGALAAILPTVVTALPDRLGDYQVARLNPVATALGVLAGTMILLDKLYGFSSSWIRYATTYQTIQGNLEAFKLGWQRKLFEVQPAQASSEQVRALFDFLGAFLASVNAAVQGETQSWVAEFKGALNELDKAVEAQRMTAAAAPMPGARGALRVEIVPLELLDDKRWTLQLENGKEELKEGQSSAVVTALEPGIYKLRVAAQKKGRPVAMEQPVVIKAGEVFEVRLERLG